MGSISQNAAFNQFHNIVVNQSSTGFLCPPADRLDCRLVVVCELECLPQNLFSITEWD